jgi:hypothetical protein
MKEIPFAAGAATDPYGFKPTDVIVDRDGSLLVSDWDDDQRPKRGRGRLYRIAYARRNAADVPTPKTDKGVESAIAQLDSPSYFARVATQEALEHNSAEGLKQVRRALKGNVICPIGRLHAAWVMAHVGGLAGIPDLLTLARSDADPRVRAQAVRAIADLRDPLLSPQSSHPQSGDSDLARRLSELAINQDPRVVLEIVVALGRLHWSGTPAWLRDHLQDPDAALTHAALQALRRSDNWPAVLMLLDEPDQRPMHRIALGALADRADSLIVDGLIDRLRAAADSPARRRRFADALSRVHKKPGPWTYWGFRPAPRPINFVSWERTAAIEKVLDGVLADPDRDVRAAILQRMQREQIPIRLAALRGWLHEERSPARLKVILDAAGKFSADETRDLLEDVVGQSAYPLTIRQ